MPLHHVHVSYDFVALSHALFVLRSRQSTAFRQAFLADTLQQLIIRNLSRPNFNLSTIPFTAMLHFRLNRARRRWSIAHDMDHHSQGNIAVQAPPVSTMPAAPPSPQVWPHSSTPDHSTAPCEQQKPRRRRARPLRVPRLSHTSSIISTSQLVSSLHSHFPARFHACDWQAVYSTMRDGVSLQTFYKNCAGPDPIVLVIRDGGKAVFGYYCSVPWKSSKNYYGNGEGFVFTLVPKFEVYKWSRANSFFQLGGAESMAVGGGGKFALFLDSMFERGSSGPCATYNSPCLASSNQFDVVVLEAYKLVSPRMLVMEKADEILFT